MAIRRITSSERDFVRYRTTIANAIVGQLLPSGVVKGGTALKLRFGNSATRFTTDLDTARSESLDRFIDELSERLDEGWEGFTGRIVTRTPASPADVPHRYVMQPFDVKLSYAGRAWCTVPLEVGHNEIGDACEPELSMSPDVAEMFTLLGFPEPGPIPLMPLHHQIAQKLHGLSEPNSKRAHDLVDLQLISKHGSVDLRKTRETCERLFAYRKAQPWPCEIRCGTGWGELYASAAADLPVLQDLNDAIEWANELIHAIAGQRPGDASQ
ncbi:protein of unknown function (DUF1814) [Slackia heliotrinireducens DSM 20476]|uniref:Nucleotidyl transferase AbiEii/AbiGii toxin family protein n=1 Tax=Slackia heliotrinireducens (strain ATCC 29202 / DSM 20476 / NCTC 11029 / RHS 1) TaxID=471855 RepID=C7N233_SLAHD|nr:protein of unknown function (DUF1814) [Slackia heliotrinireducens DSM 20476]